MVSQMAQSEAGIWVYLHGQAQKASLRSSGRPSFKYSGHVGGTLESVNSIRYASPAYCSLAQP